MMKTLKKIYIGLAKEQYDYMFVSCLIIAECLLGYLIIHKVPYTEIDWVAYMQEVDFWLDGEYNYLKIYGNTGPLVYPAGFLYLFGFLQWLTNREIPKAQIFFLGFYVFAQATVFGIYLMVLRQIRKSRQYRTTTKEEGSFVDEAPLSLIHEVWSFRIAIGLLCLSKRYHSIFLLRLFNDGSAMLVSYVSFWCFMNNKWNLGCFIFSLAVSLKMNVLLFAPGLLFLLIRTSPILTVPRLAICGITQLIIGAPFLVRHPISYLRKAFELDRKFFFKWTVNLKFLPEDVFLSKTYAITLLCLHIGLLCIYHYRLYQSSRSAGKNKSLSPEQILSTLFVSNFIGICCARTLHYQFYAWYFSSLPYLLWRETPYPIPMRLFLLAAVEYAFLEFPATPTSSSVLQIAHWIILIPCVLITESRSDQLKNEMDDDSKKNK
jgi:alpha-1,3-mannosyltransferase